MDDSRIVELFWQRSEQAIHAVEEKYGTMCRTLAYHLLRSAEDADECVNDTYHGLWNAIPPERPERLGAFCARITRNLAMKRLTYRNAAKRAVVTVSFEELNECLSAGVTAEDILEGKELAALLERFLDTLDRDSRNMFLRRYWFFDPIRQIATGFGVTESKVKSKLFRMRRQLKEYLAKEGQIYVE